MQLIYEISSYTEKLKLQSSKYQWLININLKTQRIK